MNNDKISKRTQVLMAIREFELSEGRGIGFNELNEKLSHIERSSVSLSLDMLDDRFLIHQADAKSILVDGMWRKVITTSKCFQPFIDTIIGKIKAEVRFSDKLDAILDDPDLEEKLKEFECNGAFIISEEDFNRRFTI